MTGKASAYVGGLLGILLALSGFAPAERGFALAEPGAAAGAPTAAELHAPSAHNPCFDQPGLWPEDVKKTAYYQQKWEPARLLVWARTGQRMEAKALMDPKNWLEYPPSPGGYDEKSGKPATQPPDENTDVLFPDSDRSYEIGGGAGITLRVRHLTLGAKATFGYGVDRLEIGGNVWLRKDLGHFGSHTHSYFGNKATFLRNDRPLPKAGIPPDWALALGVNKPKGGSIEFLGPWAIGDELHIDSGTMLLGPNSVFYAGNRGPHVVYPGGTLVLMSGSTFRIRANKCYHHDLIVSGTVLAGTPERPLKSDCVFCLSFKAHGEVDASLPQNRHLKNLSTPNDSGLVINPEGRLAVHSADPAKARLVFRWHGLEAEAFVGPDAPRESIKDVPRRIAIILLGQVELNGVEFNDMRRGGIVLADPSVRRQWENVFHGKNNGGSPEELYRVYDGPKAVPLQRK